MGLDSTSQIAEIIGNNIRETQTIKESYADSGDASFLLAPFNNVRVSGELTVNRRTIVGVLTAGHPVYGEVDAYPVFMPIVLGHSVWGVLGLGYLSGSVSYSYEELFSKSF